MTRRGEALREHILDIAKEAFLEAGFERTSMDALAARAQTSKRSLYAHFPTKEALFLAVVDHIDELFHGRMLTPDQYSDEPREAVTRYCGRFLQMLNWDSMVLTCRLGISAATQFPEAANRMYQVFFDATTVRLAAYLNHECSLDAVTAAATATDVLGASVYPQLPRLLFGATPAPVGPPDPEHLADDVDLPAIRRVVEARLGPA